MFTVTRFKPIHLSDSIHGHKSPLPHSSACELGQLPLSGMSMRCVVEVAYHHPSEPVHSLLNISHPHLLLCRLWATIDFSQVDWFLRLSYSQEMADRSRKTFRRIVEKIRFCLALKLPRRAFSMSGSLLCSSCSADKGPRDLNVWMTFLVC